MICPVCREEGRKSKVFYHGTTTTLIGGQIEWFDEEGIRHRHEPNWSTTEWSCSNGHQGTIALLPACGAGDYGGETRIKIR